MTTPPDIEHQDQAPDVADFGNLIAEISALAIADVEPGQAPPPIAAGTFAMYPMPDGGVMFVTSVDTGPLAGVKRSRIAPGMIRAVSVLAGGGGKLAALKALTGRGRKALTDG